MNELTLKDSKIAMDSREIAKLLNARHADVVVSIETQLSKVGYTDDPQTYQNEQNGQVYKYYLLPFRETMILASGYSIELRSKIIDRWTELETGFHIPKNMAEALRLAADQAQQIEDMKPAYEFGNFLIEARKGWLSISEAAALLEPETGLGRNNLFAWLRSHKILMESNVPYREYIERGYFRVTEKATTIGPQVVTLVSNAGLSWIVKQFKLSN
jgi:phage antirepressor YoqD-like protein